MNIEMLFLVLAALWVGSVLSVPLVHRFLVASF
jgi:hypothetical protein